VNPPGGNVVYSISRREDSTGTFAQVGVSGARSFTDDNIPAGTPSIQYTIRGFRGQTVGPASAIFTLQFGHWGRAGVRQGQTHGLRTAAHQHIRQVCRGSGGRRAPFLIWGGGGRRDGFATLRGPLLPSPP